LLRFWRATINSRNGLAFAVRSEQAIREELIALVIALPLACLIGKTTMRSVELVAAVLLVLVTELRAGQGFGLGRGRRGAGDGRPVLAVRHRRAHGGVLGRESRHRRESGRSSIPETPVIDREAAAYWMPRMRGA
jgi:hypothetical protein